jgi:NTE family protein
LQHLAIEATRIQFCCVATDLVTGQEVRLQHGPMVDAVRASISIPGIFTPFQRGDQYLGDGGIVNPLPVDVMREIGTDVIVAVNLNAAQAVSTPEANPPLSESAEDNVNSLPDSEDTLTEQQPPIANERVNALLNKIQHNYEVVREQLHEKIENWMPEQKQEMNIFDVIGTSLNVMEQQVTQSKLQVCPPDILLEPALNDYGIFDFYQAEEIVSKGYQVMQNHMPTLERLLA